MVANYVMLRVKVRTKELITAREMKCSPERHRESLHAFTTSHPFVLWKSQVSGIIGNSLKEEEREGGSINTKSVIFEHRGRQFGAQIKP